MPEETKVFQRTILLEKQLKKSEQSRVDLVRDADLGVRYISRFNSGGAEVYRNLLRLQCEHLPQILGVREEDGETHVIEEYVDGDRLDQLLEAGPLTDEQARSITMQICEALTALHGVDAVHRDVKPENILICGQKAVLIDFDASRICKENQSNDTRIMGTNGYAAPEQYGFSQTDARTDIYALGIVLNEMLTGKHPAIRLAEEPFRSVIEKCIAVNADRRYASADELKAALASCGRTEKKTRRIVVAAAVLLAVIAGGVFLGRRMTKPPAGEQAVSAEELAEEIVPAAAETASPEEPAEKSAPEEEPVPEETEEEPAPEEIEMKEIVLPEGQETIWCVGRYCGDCYADRAYSIPEQRTYLLLYRMDEDGRFTILKGDWEKEMDPQVGTLSALHTGVNIWNTKGVTPGSSGTITLRKDGTELIVPVYVPAEAPEFPRPNDELSTLLMRHELDGFPIQPSILASPGAMFCYFFRRVNGQEVLLDDRFQPVSDDPDLTITDLQDGSYFLEYGRLQPGTSGVITFVGDGKEYTIPYDIVEPY